MHYSSTTNGFYTPEIHGGGMPADAFAISDAVYIALLEAQALGKRIVPDADGNPIAVDQPAGPLTVPNTVSMRQARLALLAAGLLQTVTDAVAAIPGATGDAARIEWEYAQVVERGSPLVETLSSALGLTDDQLDALFAAAEGY